MCVCDGLLVFHESCVSLAVMTLDRLENHTHVRRRFPRYHNTMFRGQPLWDPHTHVVLPPSALVPRGQASEYLRARAHTDTHTNTHAHMHTCTHTHTDTILYVGYCMLVSICSSSKNYFIPSVCVLLAPPLLNACAGYCR